MSFGTMFSVMAKASFIHTTGVTFIYCYLWAGPFPRFIFTLYVISTFLLCSLGRFLLSCHLRRMQKNGYRYSNALIVGMGAEAKRLKRFINSGHSFGINFMGYIARNKNESNPTGISLFDTSPPESLKGISDQKSGKTTTFLDGSQAVNNDPVKQIKEQIEQIRQKNQTKRIFNTDEFPGFSSKVIGTVGDLPELIQSGKIDNLCWALPASEDFHLKEIIDLCEKYMVRFFKVPIYLSLPFRNLDADSYDGLPVFHYRKEPLEDLFNRFIKRSFDIIFSFVVIILILSWLIPLVWIIMKFSMPGPVLFKQDRSGKDNKTFKVLKFRSMKVNEDSDKVQATKDDSRITKLGSFLRKSSLDEMPQFLNVFLGQMTVVGPRPHMLSHTEEYSEQIDTFMVRHLIKPGITGWAQVNGYRGGTENIEQMEDRVEHDVWYLENWSFWLDMRIVVKTITNAAGGEENAY